MNTNLSGELSGFVQSGVSVLIGTRDVDLVPEACRGLGARVERGRREVTVFVPEVTGTRTFDNLRDNGRIAVCFSRAIDHRSVQLKGRVLSIEPATDDDRIVIDVYRASIAHAWGELGFPPRITMSITHWPAVAVRFAVESVFEQTPGPRAGVPIQPAEGAA